MSQSTEITTKAVETVPRKVTVVGAPRHVGVSNSGVVPVNNAPQYDVTLVQAHSFAHSASTQPQVNMPINTSSDVLAVAPSVLPKPQGQSGINIHPASLITNPTSHVNLQGFSGLYCNTGFNFSKKELKNIDLNAKILAALSELNYRIPTSITNSMISIDSLTLDASTSSVFSTDNIINRAAMEIKRSIKGIPEDAIKLSLIGMINIASWGRYYVEVRPNWDEPVVDYIVIAAKSGTRKSALGNILRKPFEEFTNESISETDPIERQALAKSCNSFATLRRRIKIVPLALSEERPEAVMEELVKHAKDEAVWERLAGENTKVPQFLISATSQVALLRDLASGSGCLGIIATEGDFLKSDALLGKGSPVAFLKGHTGEPIFYASAKQGTLIIQKPALPQIHLVQPDVLASLSGKKYLRKNGVLPRFQVYLCPDAMQSNTAVIDDEGGDAAVREFQTIIKRIISNNYTHSSPRSIKKLHLSTEARGIIEAYEREMAVAAERTQNDDLRAFVSKCAGQAVRFAGDLHLLTHPDDPCEVHIAGDTMRAGIALSRMLLPHAAALYNRHGLVAREHGQLILNWIADWREKAGRYARRSIVDLSVPEWHQFTSRDVQQGIAALKSDIGLILAAFDVLEYHGWIAQIATGKNTRLCVLNPHIWGAL